jgi:DeoR family suf operon transcriptional repressor
MPNTRQQIIALLGRRTSLTASDLSHLLNRTPANIRHHLANLIEDGVVVVVGERYSQKRGRPVIVYALTSHTRLHNLDKLSSTLLSELSIIFPNEQGEILLKKLADNLAGPIQIGRNTQVERLNRATQVLNSMNYQARWEARLEAPMITFKHCPYAAIIADHPEICTMDVRLLEKLLNAQIKMTARLEIDSQGLTYCGFRMERSTKSADQI